MADPMRDKCRDNHGGDHCEQEPTWADGKVAGQRSVNQAGGQHCYKSKPARFFTALRRRHGGGGHSHSIIEAMIQPNHENVVRSQDSLKCRVSFACLTANRGSRTVTTLEMVFLLGGDYEDSTRCLSSCICVCPFWLCDCWRDQECTQEYSRLRRARHQHDRMPVHCLCLPVPFQWSSRSW